MAQIRETVSGPYAAFRDRGEAGRELAEFLIERGERADAVAAVPSGGVAVAVPLAQRLGLPVELVLVRKLPLAQKPEAGFGAVSLGGDLALNRRAVRAWGLTEETVGRVAARVRAELEHRRRLFRADRPPLELPGRRVLAVDDGLASGYTMMAAVAQLRRREPAAVCIAVPDAPVRTIEAVEQVADELYCLVAQRGGPFAVASFYQRWHDLSDAEVLELLGEETQP